LHAQEQCEKKRQERQDAKDVLKVTYVTRTKWSEIPQNIKDLWEFYKPQHTTSASNIFPHGHEDEKQEKEWRRDLHNRHVNKHRNNAKETRRREYLKRVATIAKKIGNQAPLDASNNAPHADEQRPRPVTPEIWGDHAAFDRDLLDMSDLEDSSNTDEDSVPTAERRTDDETDSEDEEDDDDREIVRMEVTPIDALVYVNARLVPGEGPYIVIEELPTFWRRKFKIIHPTTGREIVYGHTEIAPHGLADDYPDDKEIVDQQNQRVIEALAKKRHPRVPPMSHHGDYRTGPYKGPTHDPQSAEAQRKQMQEELDKADKKEEPDSSETKVSESQFDDAEEIQPDVDFSFVDSRNAMARAVDSTPAFDKTEEQHKEVLKKVGSAWDLIPEGICPKDMEQIDEWISHIENLTILSYQMYRSETFLDMFVAIVAYAKMYCKKRSIIMELYKLIDEVTTTTKEIEPNAMSDWTGRKALDSWEHFKTNTIWKKVSYLISAAMSLTACTTKKIEWSPFGLRLVAVEAAKEQLGAVDVLDALIKTFVWFCEAGCQCIQQRSLAPLLYSDAKLAAYDKNCDYVLAYADSAVAGNVDDLGQYEKRLDEVISRTAIMKSAKTSGASALWLQNRYVELVGIKEKLVAKRRNTDIRQKPDGWSITGATKVGKSILADLVMKQSLAAQGYCENGKIPNDRILTRDMFDKYDSTWTSDILGVFMDDLGNSKAQTNQTDMNHTAVIIKFFNNVAAQAIKAELNSKGVVFIDFRCGVVTSNVMDLDARSYSNCPESILRRFKHVTVKVKEKYRLPGSTMINEDHPELIAAKSAVVDVWELCVWDCHVYETADQKSAWKWKLKTVEMEDGSTLTCKDIGLEQFLEVVRILALKHKKAQEAYVERAKHTSEQAMCVKCHRFPEYCKCTIDPNAFDLGDIVVNAAKKAAWKYFEGWIRPIKILNGICGYSPVKQLTTSQLAKVLEKELDNQVTPVICSITPEWLYKTSVFQSSVAAWQHTAALYDIRKTVFKAARWTTYGVVTMGVLAKLPSVARMCGLPTPDFRNRTTQIVSVASLMTSGVLFACGQYMHSLRMAHYEKEFQERRDALPVFAKRIRDGSFPKGVLLAGTLILGLKIMTLWNDNRVKEVKDVSPQGISPGDVDKQPGWFGYMLKSVGFNVKGQKEIENATTGQVMNTIQKNIFWAIFTRADGTTVGSNIYFPRKSTALFPMHVFYPGCDVTGTPTPYMKVEVNRSTKAGGKFEFMVEFDTVAASKDLDMCMAFVPNSPDIKSSVHWLPLNRPTGRSMCNMIYRDRSVNINHERVCVEHGMDGHKFMNFYGGRYTSKKTKVGLCMAPLVAEGSNCVIVGFHIGGNTEKNIGVMQTLTKPLYEQMLEKLKTFGGVELSAEAVDLPEKQYGKIIVASPEVHPHAKFVRELDENAYIEVIGSTRLRASAKSKVEKSILSDSVEKHFHVVNHWGAPRLKPNWKAFNATLEHIINPSGCFLPSKLERARQDWLKPMLKFAIEQNKVDSIRPLTDKEVIMGVPGKRFLEAMIMKTGMGFPIFGPKNKWFEDMFDEKGNLIDRKPDPLVLAEVKRIEDAWLRGERAYPVTTATLKDEPTPVDSEKVRVFQAGAVALSMLIRKYFLPIARLLSLNPLLSESAVGVNAFSPQWQEMMGHVKKYAHDGKVIAWDYSKYDVRMNSQVTRAVWLTFIELAEVCDYSKRDLTIMRNAIVDIVHPLIDYNGTMIMAYNMNTSGNNLTVNVNGLAGSLYVRMGFFEQYPDAEDFRSCVAALTYGDDFEGSVKEEYRNFNFLTFRDFLAKHNMKITLPDKSDDEVDFMDMDDADFLKRKSIFIREIGYYIGALNEMSIYKSLHANLASRGASKVEVAMSCIDGAMHEWFAHGKDVYEDRRTKMMAICEEMDLPMPSVQVTFEERVEAWKEKYL
jgi:hypothetical protein